ncbi:hypothetical protein Tco_1420311 [Tanacetum coccineum]
MMIKSGEDLQQCFESCVYMKKCAINAIPLATKPTPIVNFQIHKKGRNGYYEIMRADGSAKTYLLFSQLLKEFDREDLKIYGSWLKQSKMIQGQKERAMKECYGDGTFRDRNGPSRHYHEESDDEFSDIIVRESCNRFIAKVKLAKICLGVDLEPDEWIKDSGCSRHMTGNQKLFSTYKAYNGGNVIFGSNLRGNIIGKGQICDNKCRVTFSEYDSEITKDGKFIGKAKKSVKLMMEKLFRMELELMLGSTVTCPSRWQEDNFTEASVRRDLQLADEEDLYKLVKAKYESTKPVEDLDLLLWGDLKTMFEPHIEDAVWRNQQAYKVLDWKLYEEKKYPLAPLTLLMMLEKKLNIDYESKMAYQLLKFIIK